MNIEFVCRVKNCANTNVYKRVMWLCRHLQEEHDAINGTPSIRKNSSINIEFACPFDDCANLRVQEGFKSLASHLKREHGVNIGEM